MIEKAKRRSERALAQKPPQPPLCVLRVPPLGALPLSLRFCKRSESSLEDVSSPSEQMERRLQARKRVYEARGGSLHRHHPHWNFTPAEEARRSEEQDHRNFSLFCSLPLLAAELSPSVATSYAHALAGTSSQAPKNYSNELKKNSKQGNRTTPSYVAFTNTERLIGDAAKSQVAMNPINTVFDAKRLIGRKFNDPTIQADIKHWPFKVKPGVGDKPMIEGELY